MRLDFEPSCRDLHVPRSAVMAGKACALGCSGPQVGTYPALWAAVAAASLPFALGIFDAITSSPCDLRQCLPFVYLYS